MENLRIHRTVYAHRPRVSESKELLIQIDRGSVIKKPNVRITKTVAKQKDVIECHNEKIVAVRIKDT